jgi:hypothetical protein
MRCAISLLVGIFCLPAIAIVHVVSPVITSSSPITTGKVIRPSQGETVTAGEAYTVSWSPPPVSGPIDIELWDDHNKNFNAADLTGNLTPNTTCDGWVINGDCGKIAKNLLSESTSYGMLGSFSSRHSPLLPHADIRIHPRDNWQSVH